MGSMPCFCNLASFALRPRLADCLTQYGSSKEICSFLEPPGSQVPTVFPLHLLQGQSHPHFSFSSKSDRSHELASSRLIKLGHPCRAGPVSACSPLHVFPSPPRPHGHQKLSVSRGPVPELPTSGHSKLLVKPKGTVLQNSPGFSKCHCPSPTG